MPASHRLQITYDESTGTVTAVHRCTVTVPGHPSPITHAREIELDPESAAALKGVLDANRDVLEAETGELAVDHAAAVSGKVRKGVRPLKVGGSLGPVSTTDTAKG
jgi:hypothetical protein